MAFPVPRSLSPSKVSSFTDCALAFRAEGAGGAPVEPAPGPQLPAAAEMVGVR
jgi:hypothetical protein